MSKTVTASYYLKNKQFPQAAALLEKLLSEKPDDLGSLDLLGRAYFELHKYQDAYDIFRKLHAVDRTNIEWTHLLARCLFSLGNYKKAYALASYVVQHEGPTEDNLLTRGLAAQKGGLREEAEADFRSILEINPTHADSLHNLANLVAAKKQFVEAIQLFEKSYKINPANKAALANAIYYARSTSSWIVERTYSSEIASLGVEGGVISPFSMLALDDDLSRHQARSRTFWRVMTQGIEKCASQHPSNDRLRIGYFSSDFYDHATMHLFADVLRYHDRSQFEIFGYIIKRPKMDHVSLETLALFEHVKDVSAQTDKHIAEIAREDKIDIAVDLKGFTSFARPGIFAYGAGKVQINYLGYPGTMGTPMMDYIIADQVVIPPSHEQYYDEKVIRLPNCYQANRELRPDQISVRRSDFGLPSDALVLASFNAIYKVGLEEFLLWLEILKKHSQAVLWIMSDVEQAHANLLHLATQQGISSDRIIRAEPVSHHKHIARLSLADLFLDTFNVGAHTTASDALRAGLPVITKLGGGFASRVASSLLKSCKLDHWIACSVEEYFQKIDDYLSDGDLETQKAKVRAAVAESDLFNPRSYTKDLENLYLDVMIPHTQRSGRCKKKERKAKSGTLGRESCATTGDRDAGKAAYEVEVLVPSNRPWSEVGPNLSALEAQARSSGFKVIVSDNSCDPRKAVELQNLQAKHFQVHLLGKTEATENWQNTFRSATADFIQFVADDDTRIQFNESVWANKVIPLEVVGIVPICLLKSPDRGFYGIRQFNIDGENPSKRLTQYSKQSQGANTLLYSSWRRDLWENVNLVSINHHPCSAGYQDWSVTRAMLIEGQVLSDQSVIYVYANDNWFGPPSSVNHEICRLFKRSGMSEDLMQFFPELRLLDDIVFILRFNGYRESLEDRYKVLRQILGKSVLSTEELTISALLESILSKIKSVDPAAGGKYEKFIVDVIDRRCLSWGVS